MAAEDDGKAARGGAEVPDRITRLLVELWPVDSGLAWLGQPREELAHRTPAEALAAGEEDATLAALYSERRRRSWFPRAVRTFSWVGQGRLLALFVTLATWERSRTRSGNSYSRFYEPLGVSPEEVGLDYRRILSESASGVAEMTLAISWIIASIVISTAVLQPLLSLPPYAVPLF